MVRQNNRLGWFGHLERKDEGDWVSACRNMVLPGNAEKGRARKRCFVLEDDLKKGRLDRGLAKDRDRRKAQIIGKTSDLCEHGKEGRKMRRERVKPTSMSVVLALARNVGSTRMSVVWCLKK